MHGHQGDFLALGVVHVLVGQQRGLGKEVPDLVMLVTAFFFGLLEVVDGVHQLVQVLDATDVFQGIVPHEHTLDLRALDGLLGHGHGIVTLLVEFDEPFHQGGEALKFGERAAVHVQSVLFSIVHHLPHAHAVLVGAMCDFAHGGVADAAGGVVDDTAQRLVIVGVDDEPEIADGVFYLLALVERQAAVDAVGDGAAHVAVLVAPAAVAQGFLQYA